MNVHKSEQGWTKFREKTDNGKRKRPVQVFKNRTVSKYRRVK